MQSPDGTFFDFSGPADAPVVVLIHGLGLNNEVWQWLVPDLSRRFRVLTYDIFGHGQSSNPPINPNLKTLSDQLFDLLSFCGIARAGIVGFSLGGMIARRFAQDHSEMTGALAILHSPHRRSPEAQAAIVARVVQAGSEGPKSTVEAALVRWFTDRFRAENTSMMDLVRKWVLANDPAIYPSLYRILADGIDEIVSPDPALTCPALILTGDEDYGNGPEMTLAIAAEINGAGTVILKGLRHMALVEDPAAVNLPVLAFLEKNLIGTGA